MSQESILAHLAPRLTSQIENVATDALAHLLLQYQFLDVAFREYISTAGIELPGSLSIKTQARWQDAAIPDLVGLDEAGRYLLIIESKFWAPLTSNQPETYIERLPPDRSAILLFIAPSSRIPTLWSELLNRCNPSIASSQDKIQAPSAQFQILPLNNMHILALTSWESLLEVLHKKALQAENHYAAGDIWQLQSLCEKIDADTFQPLSESDITSPTKMLIIQFRGLIDELVNHLVESGIVSIIGYKATPGPDYYKRYMTISNFQNWCIEYNEQYRKQHPPTALWLTNTYKPQFSGLMNKLEMLCFRQDNQILIPLEIPLHHERESVLQKLIKQITEVSKELIK